MLLESVLALAMAQAVIVKAPGDSVLWEQPDAVTASVVNFQVCLDATPCVTVLVADAKVATTPDTYKWKLPALTIGTHTIKVSACAADICSDPAVLDFKLVIAPMPPKNLRAGS